MSTTTLPAMIVEDAEPSARSGLGLGSYAEPMDCDHRWEPHLWEVGRALCPRCGSCGRWVNDPRAEASP